MSRSKNNLLNLVKTTPEAFAKAPNVLAVIQSGAAKYQSNKPYYFRKKIDLSGNQKLIESATLKAYGVTNFESGKIVSNRGFMIEGIAIRYAYNASTTTVYAQNYSSCVFDPTDVTADATDQDAGVTGAQSAPVPARLIPNQLTDSEFSLQIAGKELFSCMTKDFFVENVYQREKLSSSLYTVNLEDYGIVINGEQTIEPWLYFNPNVTTPSNNHFIEYVMYGTEIFS